jgi:hypothetical protein
MLSCLVVRNICKNKLTEKVQENFSLFGGGPRNIFVSYKEKNDLLKQPNQSIAVLFEERVKKIARVEASAFGY